MSVAAGARNPSGPDHAVVRAEAIDLVRFTAEVTDWIARYTGRLDRERPRDLAGEHETMRRMAAVYDERSGHLIRIAPDLERMLPAEAAALKTVTLRFRDNLALCTSKLKAKYTVGEWLIRAVSEEMTKRANPVQRYNRDAALQRGTAGAAAPPLAINRTV